MPSRLRVFDAYKRLQAQISDFQIVLPLLQELSKESIMPRHWEELKEITKSDFDQTATEFKLQTVLELKLESVAEDVMEITDGADKQLKIEKDLKEIDGIWQVREFAFKDWKTRAVPTLQATGALMEELEEAQMQLQTMLTMRHVAPFREETQAQLAALSDASDTLERWVKVQLMFLPAFSLSFSWPGFDPVSRAGGARSSRCSPAATSPSSSPWRPRSSARSTRTGPSSCPRARRRASSSSAARTSS